MSKPIAEVKYRLGKAIDMKGKTQQELSDETGISKSSISQYIHGYSKPRPTNIVKLARALDVDPGWLTGFDVPMKKAEECLPIYEAAAGEGRIGDGSPCGEYRITIDQDHVLVEVKGDSMYPTLQDGDIVAVKPQKYVDSNSQIALVKINGDEATLKRVEMRDDGILLIGDNISVYQPHFFSAEQVSSLPVSIEGVVVTMIRHF